MGKVHSVLYVRFSKKHCLKGWEGNLGMKALNTMTNESCSSQISLCRQEGGVEGGH